LSSRNHSPGPHLLPLHLIRNEGEPTGLQGDEAAKIGAIRKKIYSDVILDQKKLERISVFLWQNPMIANQQPTNNSMGGGRDIQKNRAVFFGFGGWSTRGVITESKEVIDAERLAKS